MGLKRLELKYVRDKAKTAYEKGQSCEACNTTEDLQLHHFYTLDFLWDNWKLKNDIKIASVEDIISVRDDFIEKHKVEIYEEVATLCKVCHNDKLHALFGQKPLLSTAKKQKKWLKLQRQKNGIE